MYLNTIAPADWTLTAINQTDATLATLEAELATGTTTLAVNPADTIISTQMQGQLGVLSQTQQNLQQNTDLLQTANGATQSIQGILQQMQALAVQASNGTESSQNRSALQEQYNALLNSMAAISQVQYNGIALLNPTEPSEITY
jgi:flagellin